MVYLVFLKDYLIFKLNNNLQHKKITIIFIKKEIKIAFSALQFFSPFKIILNLIQNIILFNLFHFLEKLQFIMHGKY